MLNLFEKIVGEENVSSAEPDLIAYSTDASQVFGSAKAVVWPRSAEELRKIVLVANRTSIPLVVRGGGTSLVGSAVPINSVVVDLSKMNRIIKIDESAKEAVVQPGVVLDDLNKKLKEHDLVFPVQPASHPSCTIGGLVSTNAVGLNAIKYGKTADWVKELEVIDGTGKFFVVKADDIKNFCGTEGTVGIITQITLRLSVPYKKITLSLFITETLDELMDRAKELLIKETLAMEYINKPAAKLMGMSEKYHLIVEFESDSGEIKDQKEIDAIMAKRESFTSEVLKQGYTQMEDPQLDFSKLQELLEWFDENQIPCASHLAVGITHPVFTEETKKLIPEMYKLVKSLGGQVSGEHGIGLNKKQYVEPGFADKIRQLKKIHDPSNLLNPGKVIS